MGRSHHLQDQEELSLHTGRSTDAVIAVIAVENAAVIAGDYTAVIGADYTAVIAADYTAVIATEYTAVIDADDATAFPVVADDVILRNLSTLNS